MGSNEREEAKGGPEEKQMTNSSKDMPAAGWLCGFGPTMRQPSLHTTKPTMPDVAATDRQMICPDVFVNVYQVLTK